SVLALLLGCDDGGERASTVAPVFGDGCRFAECGGHGDCAEAEDGSPMCLCEVGYGGDDCSACERGFHVDALGRCAPDRACAEQETPPCGQHGTCDDSDGVIMCACDPGYEGPRCTLCRSGWGRNEFGECLQL